MRQRSRTQDVIRVPASIVLSFLPERYRPRFAWGFATPQGAILSGALQLVVCIGVLIYRYFGFFNQRMALLPDKVVLGAAEKGGETAIMGMGLYLLMDYLIQPVTLLLIYFLVEGLLRGGAAIASGEIVPTLPLQLLSLAHVRIAHAKHERDLGPPIEDLVQPGSGDFALCVASCRPKPWTRMTTIAYEDQLYELVREEQGQPPRKWLYVLRKRPESKIIRGAIYDYHRDELLLKEPNAVSADASMPN